MRNFSEIYTEFCPRLLRFAGDFIARREDAENVVHDMFTELWNSNAQLEGIQNVNAYLFLLVRNRCLDYLKHKVYERNYEIYAKEELQVRVDAVSRMSDYGLLEQEAESVVQRAVNNLPPRCREIFLLSRIEGLKYCEIADRLNLSENTVGVQMGIALKRLRAALSEY